MPLKEPRQIDGLGRANATSCLLDRIVNSISPVLWKKIRNFLQVAVISCPQTNHWSWKRNWMISSRRRILDHWWCLQKGTKQFQKPASMGLMAMKLNTNEEVKLFLDAQKILPLKVEKKERRRNAPLRHHLFPMQMNAANKISFTYKTMMMHQQCTRNQYWLWCSQFDYLLYADSAVSRLRKWGSRTHRG